jgi:protein-S-isoprenylcysteine O-methyltransferase Ste14
MPRPDTLPAAGGPRPRNPLALRVPPPVLLAVSAVAMWLIAYRWPRFWMPFPWRVELALALLALGSLVAAMAVAAFLGARTTVDPRHPERSAVLVTGGVFRISRNPMYLGLALWLAAWGVYLANALAWGVPLLFVAAVTWLQIRPEERALQARFGDAYAHYRGRVRRWI